MAILEVSDHEAVDRLHLQDLSTNARCSVLSGDDDMYMEEDVSHSFFRDDELLTAYGAMGFYDLWSRNHSEPELSKPHMGVIVCDSSRSTLDTLASEVAAAITVLKFRFRRGDFVNFHTIPVSLPSFPAARHRPGLMASRSLFTAFITTNPLASPRRIGMAMVL